MEAFDASMFPHSVILEPDVETTDADAAVVETFAPVGPPVPLPCRIRLSGSRPGVSAAGQEITITFGQIAFPADPGCKKGDDLVQPVTGLTFRATSPARARDADGALFVVAVELRD